MRRILLLSTLAVLVAGCGPKPTPAVNDADLAAQARATGNQLVDEANAHQAAANDTMRAEGNTAMQLPDVAPGRPACHIVPGVNGANSRVVCP